MTTVELSNKPELKWVMKKSGEIVKNTIELKQKLNLEQTQARDMPARFCVKIKAGLTYSFACSGLFLTVSANDAVIDLVKKCKVWYFEVTSTRKMKALL